MSLGNIVLSKKDKGKRINTVLIRSSLVVDSKRDMHSDGKKNDGARKREGRTEIECLMGVNNLETGKCSRDKSH